MRINVQTDGVYLGATKTAYTSKSTGQPGYFYNVAVKQEGEVGNLPCTKDVYELLTSGAAGVKEYTPAYFAGVYDDRYNRLTVTEVGSRK